MRSDDDLPTLLSEQLEVALDELSRASGLTIAEIVELVDYGVFEPSGQQISGWRFSARTITLGRRASRLKSDFELNSSGVALALTYLQHIEELEAEIRRLRCESLG